MINKKIKTIFFNSSPLFFLTVLILMMVYCGLRAEEDLGQEALAEQAPTASLGAEDVSNTTPEKSSEEKEEEAIKSLPLKERLNRRVSLDLRNIDVSEALRYIASKGYLNIVQTKNVSGRVSLSLENVSLKDVFDLVLLTNGLAYVMQGEDIIQVMTEQEYKALYGKNFSDLRQAKVFRLKYAIPEQAFSLLDALKSDIGRVLVDQESGNVLLMDTPERIAQMEQALEEFEKKNVVRVFVLKYAKAKDVEEILKNRLDAKKVGSIKADDRNNQVVVQTLPERMQEVADLIQQLDKPTKEVLIEAKIVKVRLDDKIDEGIEWEGLFGVSKKFGNAYAGTYPFAVNNAGNDSPTFQTRQHYYNTLGEIVAYPFSGTTSSLSASTPKTLFDDLHLGVFTSKRDLDAVIKYLKTLGKTQVLSNPKLVVLNNQEAKIHVGERQAYVTTTTTTGQSTSTVSEEVTFVDVGIQLAVTPVINDDGFITMKLRPEVSSVSTVLTTPTGNKIPIIDTSLTETTVMIKDGTTLLIGGLRKEEKLDSYEQTPILGKIPILGFPFKRGSQSTQRTELLVMITPHIISGKEFTIGDERYQGGLPSDYKEYQQVPSDKRMLPESTDSGIQLKPYRDYLTMREKTEGGLAIKGSRYEH